MILKILSIFATGTSVGFILELTFKSLKRKKIINPGVLNAQIYGTASVVIYLLSLLNISHQLKLAAIVFAPTIVELANGIIFKKFVYKKMWDYSAKKFNYYGIICFEFSFYWGLMALLGYYFIVPFCN